MKGIGVSRFFVISVVFAIFSFINNIPECFQKLQSCKSMKCGLTACLEKGPAMKKSIAMVLAAVMFIGPVLSSASAVEPLRQTQEKESFERNRRGSSYRGGRGHRGGRRHGSSSGAWVAAGILGAAVIGSAIASSSSSSRTPTYVYEQPVTVIVPSTPTYVYPSTPTYVYPSTSGYVGQYEGAVEVDPNIYMYDANGNLVPYQP